MPTFSSKSNDDLYKLFPSHVRHRIAASRLAPLAVMPERIGAVARENGKRFGYSARWLLTSREHTNYTYELTGLNRDHLAWFVANVANVSVAECKEYIGELESDKELADYIFERSSSGSRRFLMDDEVRWAKRLGWYALVRAVKPNHIVETGTDKGLGTLAFAAAVLRNGRGRVTTIDTNPEAGQLIGGRWAKAVDLEVGSSLDVIPRLAGIDLMIHDSYHRYEFEIAEFEAAATNSLAGALFLSDDSVTTKALSDWAENTKRKFLYWQESPERHWYPGGGIGVAW